MFSILARRSSHLIMQELNRSFNYEEAISYFHKEFPSIKDQKTRDQMKIEYQKAIEYKLLVSPDSYTSFVPKFEEQEYLKLISNFRNFMSSISFMALGTIGMYFIYNLSISENISPLFDSDNTIKEATLTNKTFNDVKGIDECREEIEEIVDYLKNYEKYKANGAKVHKGILLTGSPGTGKTLLAKAIAGEAGVKFLYTSGSEFDEIFYGLGAARIRKLFKVARESAPCIIFIDEIDSIESRNNSTGVSGNQTLNQLLIELDGFNQSEDIIVIAASNLPEKIDKALLRPGRFDKKIHIPPPGQKGRQEILDLYLSRIIFDPNLKKHVIINKTIGKNGAYLENLVNIAATQAAKLNKDQVDDTDFDYALDRMSLGIENKSLMDDKQELMNTAYHELGHAYIALINSVMDIHKITILPKGGSLGHTAFLPKKQSDMSTYREIIAYIAVGLGGRAAEEVFFGIENVTTGCSSDLAHATEILMRALNSGVFYKDSKICVPSKKDISDESIHAVEQFAKDTLAKIYQDVRQVIKENKEMLHHCALYLVEKETISAEEFKQQIEIFKEKQKSLNLE